MSLNRNKTIDSVQVLTIGLYISGFTLFVGLTLLIVDLISNRYLSTTTEISTLGYIGSFFTLVSMMVIIPVILISILIENNDE
nr:MAG TPA: hypothetical protein [Caudoviricetes sp.]